MNRRGFLGAILAAGVAPAIVRSSSLMKLVVPSQEIIVSGLELITPMMITLEALRILEPMLTFSAQVDYDCLSAGKTIVIRKPPRYA